MIFNWNDYRNISPHVRQSKTVLDSGIHSQVLNSSLCQWNLDSGFQLLVEFRIPWAVFRIPKSRIWDATRKFSLIPNSTSKNFPDSGIPIPLHGVKHCGSFTQKIYLLLSSIGTTSKSFCLVFWVSFFFCFALFSEISSSLSTVLSLSSPLLSSSSFQRNFFASLVVLLLPPRFVPLCWSAGVDSDFLSVAKQ